MPKPNNSEVVSDEQVLTNESDAIDAALEGIPDLPAGAQIPSPPQRAAKAKEEEPPPAKKPDGPTPKPAVKKTKEEPPPDDKKKKVEPAPPAPEPPKPKPGEQAPPPADKKPDKIQTDEEIEAELAARPKPKFRDPKEENAWVLQQTQIRSLTRARREDAERIKQLETEREEIKKQVPSADERKHVESMREYFQNTAVEQIVIPKFRNKLIKTTGDVVNLLAQAGLPKESIDYINKRGGPLVFSESEAPMDGPDGKTTEGEWFEEQVYNRLSRAQRATFDKYLGEAATCYTERDKELEVGRKHKDAYLSEQAKKNREAFDQITQSRWADRAKDLPSYIPRDFLDVPDDATDEQKAEIEEENKLLREAGEYVKTKVLAINAKDRADVAFDAGYAKYLGWKLDNTLKKYEAEKKRADDLQAELDGIDASSDFRLATNAAPPAEAGENANAGKSTEQVLDAEFG